MRLLYDERATAVIVVNHPGGMDNCALLRAESGLLVRVGRDMLHIQGEQTQQHFKEFV